MTSKDENMTPKRNDPLVTIDVVESKGPTLLLRVCGRINILNAHSFEEEVLRAAAGTTSDVVVEGSGITYISSAGLRAFLRISRNLDKRGRKLHICNLEPHIQNTFEIVGFNRVISIHSDVETALDAGGG